MEWITIWNREYTCTGNFFFFFFKGKSFDSIAIVFFFFFFFLSELVLRVTAGLKVGNVLLTDQTTGEKSVIF